MLLPAAHRPSFVPGTVWPAAGSDGALDARAAACEICERGLRFVSARPFELAALLRVTFMVDGMGRVEAEGIVAECLPVEEPPASPSRLRPARRPARSSPKAPSGKAGREPGYQVTIAFVGAPGELRAALVRLQG